MRGVNRNEEVLNDMVPLYFTMTDIQYEYLKDLKTIGYCKIMHILRFIAFKISKMNKRDIKAYMDSDFSIKRSKNYKILLPRKIYEDIQRKSDETGLSKSKLMRIGINDLLYFMNNKK